MTDTHTVPAHAELAVVGAGIVGALAAYYATRRHPGRRVLVLSHSTPARPGATGLSAGFDTPTGPTPAHRALAARSTALFTGLAAELPESYRTPVDTYWLLRRDGVAALDATLAVGGRTRAVPPERLPALRAALPGLRHGVDEVLRRSAPMTAGLPGRLAALLLDRVLDHPGNAVRDGFRVTSARRARARAGTRIELTAADGRRVTADKVLVAPGPWALNGPVAGAARARGARVKKVVAFHVTAPPPAGAPALVFEDADAFLLPHHPGGCWILSVTSPDWDRDPDGPLTADARDRALARGLLDRYVPGFVPYLTDGRVGADCFTPDRLPVVGTAGDPDVVMAIGGSGSGYRLAPAMAQDALSLLDPVDEAREGKLT
ncbi:FAD-binding oxidoreductase [Streptomyces sp. MUM 203J]|uniref:NAD(P)/FAD-dependent oxidoreductase n=1 Tax=Streptomyces sp. MUM 203J TaxID=2791990 RepID=UPI001F049175|nr:FAD-dependent oxidoreductase [Streptomyces sp. MUM 203J]MCH0539312.1 FAD-binding oxidoreductase [Streptomyces sp. MUM 203J]